MNKLRIKYSCVLDKSPMMAVQSYIWLNSLISYGIAPKDIYVHLVGEIPGEFLNYLKEQEVNIIEKKPFDVRNKYCNKLVQLETFTKDHDYDYVFLMDCDTAIVSLEGLELTEKIYAKIVDFPNPPLSILTGIFEKEGFRVEKSLATFPLNDDKITDWNNCNGGVYIIHRDFLSLLAPKWKKYSLKCIEEKESFTALYEKHADQVGFALAMASLAEKVSHLDITWNFPIHVEINGLESDAKILHFHSQIDNKINLKKTENYLVDNSIEELNSRISSCLNSNHTLHPRDIGQEKLVIGEILLDSTYHLKELVNTSRRNFGFFTSHFSRVFEYSWMLKKLEKTTGRVIDIGAGVCPLPLCLAERNIDVTTIDSHPTIREENNKNEWNEWGYLDYSRYNMNITSANLDFIDYKTKYNFDAVYSVSVIEHMPAKTRRRILRKTSHLLKKGGVLLLTIDIIPGTEQIWNLSEDKQVEPVEIHGKIGDLKTELKNFGFEITDEFLQRDLPFSRTDILYLKSRLVKKGVFSRILRYA